MSNPKKLNKKHVFLIEKRADLKIVSEQFWGI